ncbi:PepSY domain-containing protein [Streptomyces sp. HC44]|uniref:PepSY domain-containing protein n=1 Tax=Streptomyces scabichelini TaxID=2711217 RepID=A0A6G4V9J2_9ACTN|nr:PepSY domain-containing protein [Streptomyces scabichelini]NGO10749.1 PepSY domain-containing protein [Streptomyces scabichelini]
MKRNIVIATVAAAALVGGGTATALAVTSDDGAASTKPSSVRPADDSRDDDGRDDDAARDDSRTGVEGADGADDDGTQVTSSKITAAEAIGSALRHTPGTAVSADLDDEDDGGAVFWDVDVLAKDSAWHSIQIDPATGKVLGSHVEHEDDTAQVRAALKGTSVSAEEAAKAAAAKGTVTSVDLDEDGPSKAWDAETRAAKGSTEREWNVGLKTATVTADKADQGSDDSDSDD